MSRSSPKSYDWLNRLTPISSVGGTGSTLSSFAYAYNSANQRPRVTLADGSFGLYTYDALNQVTSGRKYWADGTPVLGQQFDYTFDDIGNRKVALAARLRAETTMTAGWISERLSMGSRGYRHHLLYRQRKAKRGLR